MRIGTVVVDLLDVKRVGSERRYSELLRRLEAQRGHELHLFARRWDEAAARNIACHRVPVRGPAAITPLLFALSAFLVVRRWRSRLDLVHSHTQSFGDDVVSPGGGAYLAYLRAIGRDPWGRAGREAWRSQDHARVFIEAAPVPLGAPDRDQLRVEQPGAGRDLPVRRRPDPLRPQRRGHGILLASHPRRAPGWDPGPSGPRPRGGRVPPRGHRDRPQGRDGASRSVWCAGIRHGARRHRGSSVRCRGRRDQSDGPPARAGGPGHLPGFRRRPATCPMRPPTHSCFPPSGIRSPMRRSRPWPAGCR